MGRGSRDLAESDAVFVPGIAEFEAWLPEIRTALTIRAVEERLLDLFGEGKLFGTIHTCIGQEFSGIAVARNLLPQDYVFSNHRCHGHFISYGGSVNGLMAEIMGKETGTCGGRGGSQHLCQGRFFSNGIQGGTTPVTAGLALAQQLDGNGGIAVVFVGDGTMGQGVLYETLNIAAKWRLPLLFVIENNFYAQSTPSHQTLSGRIADRFKAFGIEGSESNTWDWVNLMAAMQESVSIVRSEGYPRFHIVDTYRLKPHSKGDDFRQKDEIRRFEERDPLNAILSAFAQDPRLQGMLREIEALVDDAVEFAESSPYGAVALEDAQRPTWQWKVADFEKERTNLAIQHTLSDLLMADSKAFLLGEDIEGPYGGAFKVTGDLSLRFPGRVRNTPISEAALVGIGNGLALAGHRPVVEIMFGDFLALAADQWINHAAKFEWMYNGQATCPLLIRTPMGGRRGYGPTHSQSLERHFVGLPGTRVLCLHHRIHPRQLYQAIHQQPPQPTLLLENKRLYAIQADPVPPAGFQLLVSTNSFPVTWLTSGLDPAVTVVALGGTSVDAEAAVLEVFDSQELIADLFLPTALYPMEIDFLEESVRVSRRLLIVEEGLGFAAIGAELIAQVCERWPEMKIDVRRLCSKESPIPTARPLEEAILPTQEDIVNAIYALAHG